MRIAYLMSRFPKISETFVLREIIQIRSLGADVLIFPLVHTDEGIVHEEVSELTRFVCRDRAVSLKGLAAHWFWLRRTPSVYLKTWLRVCHGNAGSVKFLLAAGFTFVKAVRWARIALEKDVNCIHAHWATHPALGAYIVHSLTGIPYGFTAHAHDIYVERPMLQAKMRAAAYVVTISEYNRRLLCSLYGEDECSKVRVIRLGADLSLFTQPARGRVGGTFRIVCIASLEDYKGHPHLIEACRLLRDQGLSFICYCIGEGSRRRELEQLIGSAGLRKQVMLMGRRTWQDVRDHLAEAGCAVLASIVPKSGRHEGIPVALMEAMAMAVPVVATDISGVAELVENDRSGLLVPAGEPAALAGAIRRLHDDAELALRLGRQGRARVRCDYDLARNAARLYELQKSKARLLDA